MARTARVKLSGTGVADYHVMSRTNDRRFLFEKGEAKTQLVDALRRAAEFCGVRLRDFLGTGPKKIARKCRYAEIFASIARLRRFCRALLCRRRNQGSVPTKSLYFVDEIRGLSPRNQGYVHTKSLQLQLGGISPILGSLPRASKRCAWRRDTGVILTRLSVSFAPVFPLHQSCASSIVLPSIFGGGAAVADADRAARGRLAPGQVLRCRLKAVGDVTAVHPPFAAGRRQEGGFDETAAMPGIGYLLWRK